MESDVVNRLRVVTEGGKELIGFDAELYLKSQSKKDLSFEKELALWIEATIKEPLQDVNNLYLSLRDGIVLYKLLNTIKPGIISEPLNTISAMNSGSHMRERANIQLYLTHVVKLSRHVPLFSVDDLHSQKYMQAVLENLNKLREVANSLMLMKNGSSAIKLDPNTLQKYESKKWDLQYQTGPVYADEMDDTPESHLQDSLNKIHRMEIQLNGLAKLVYDLAHDNEVLHEFLLKKKKEDVQKSGGQLPAGGQDERQGKEKEHKQDKEEEKQEQDKKQIEFEKQVGEGQKHVGEGEKQVAEGKKQAGEGEKQVAEGEKQVGEGEKQVGEGEKEVGEGEKQVRECEKWVGEGEKKMGGDERQVNVGEKQAEEGNKQREGKKQVEGEKQEGVGEGVKQDGKVEKPEGVMKEHLGEQKKRERQVEKQEREARDEEKKQGEAVTRVEKIEKQLDNREQHDDSDNFLKHLKSFVTIAERTRGVKIKSVLLSKQRDELKSILTHSSSSKTHANDIRLNLIVGFVGVAVGLTVGYLVRSSSRLSP
eukprot:TRINITY_DN16673_c0_g1_i2.p1 TRINITY_DN16673_c0_g1~~TRINITY_DN16673_c0_g1_i2.p1  ORF type:complete len:537 (+),score=174.13 TRINITY_DN16673_c0_g1_i2:75-1685(+)